MPRKTLSALRFSAVAASTWMLATALSGCFDSATDTGAPPAAESDVLTLDAIRARIDMTEEQAVQMSEAIAHWSTARSEAHALRSSRTLGFLAESASVFDRGQTLDLIELVAEHKAQRRASRVGRSERGERWGMRAERDLSEEQRAAMREKHRAKRERREKRHVDMEAAVDSRLANLTPILELTDDQVASIRELMLAAWRARAERASEPRDGSGAPRAGHDRSETREKIAALPSPEQEELFDALGRLRHHHRGPNRF